MSPVRKIVLSLLVIPVLSTAESVLVGDIEIDPNGFSATLEPEQRIAQCLSCHGPRAGGDLDFGTEVTFGTPALRGMRESYLRDSLVAYQSGLRVHDEMTAISAMLDEETVDFMARHFAAFDPPTPKPPNDLLALAAKDALFRKGQTIAREGITAKAVPPCETCHGALGEGSAAGPRLGGQNALYIERQFLAFSSGTRQTPQSTVMRPVANGLSSHEVSAVAHYYQSLPDGN